jgi:hypothetical protein
MVNRWNQAMAVGLRHNHDISFIATQCKTMSIVFYVTNYATKVEDPVWKRVAAATEVFNLTKPSETGNVEEGHEPTSSDWTKQNTRQFLMKVTNRVFTERALSQVEVVAHLLGHPGEFTHNAAWTYLNTSSLYWDIFRRWHHLRHESGGATEDPIEQSVILEQTGQRITFVQAYPHRGAVLRKLSLYDYVSVVRLKRKRRGRGARGEVQSMRFGHSQRHGFRCCESRRVCRRLSGWLS